MPNSRAVAIFRPWVFCNRSSDQLLLQLIKREQLITVHRVHQLACQHVIGKVTGLDHPASRRDVGVLYHVGKLTHIARPGITRQHLPGLVRKPP